MKTIQRGLFAGVLSALLVACGGGGNMNADSGNNGGDTGNNNGDGGSHGGDGGTNTDGGSHGDSGMMMGGDAAMLPSLTGTCAMPVDLTARGTMMSGATIIQGNSSMAPADPMTGIVGPSCATDRMGTMTNHGGYAVVFDYTMHATADLVATTQLSATDANFDTIVWIVDGCGSSAHELACNDDSQDSSGNQVSQSLAATRHTIPAGTHVKIIVAGYTPSVDSTMFSMSGNFALAVQEFMPNAMGASCDGMNPFCADGYSCVFPNTAGATMGTCNANGTEGAECNTSGTPCMGNSMAGTPLGCSASMPTASDPGVCLGLNPSGGVCTANDPLCVMGAHCIADMGSMTMGHCIPDGSTGGACRTTGTPCDTGTCDMTTGLCM